MNVIYIKPDSYGVICAVNITMEEAQELYRKSTGLPIQAKVTTGTVLWLSDDEVLVMGGKLED